MKKRIIQILSVLIILLLWVIYNPITIASAASTETNPTSVTESTYAPLDSNEGTIDKDSICQKISTSITKVELFFDTNDFAKEVLIAILGTIFAAVSTVMINAGAIRKQCKFDMQYKILSEEAENIALLCKKIEELEIYLSFGTRETEPLNEKIEEVRNLLYLTQESLSKKRKFVRKYISATSVEKAKQYFADYKHILYQQGPAGFYDLQLRKKIDNDEIIKLRELTEKMNKLYEDVAENMERMISPGFFAFIGRKIRKTWMFLEEVFALGKTSKDQEIKQ